MNVGFTVRITGQLMVNADADADGDGDEYIFYNSNSNSKTLFYQDCSLGSVKNLANN